MSDTKPVLKPCPFCGAPALLSKYADSDWYGYWGVYCSDPDDTCPCNPWTVAGQDDAGREQVIAAWNRRAPQPPGGGE